MAVTLSLKRSAAAAAVVVAVLGGLVAMTRLEWSGASSEAGDGAAQSPVEIRIRSPRRPGNEAELAQLAQWHGDQPADADDRELAGDAGAHDDQGARPNPLAEPASTVGLGNDSAGPLFLETNMAPGHTATNCISVTNVGTQAALVRLYATASDGGLAGYVAFTIEAGHGSPYGDCTGFNGTEIFAGTLEQLAAEHHDFATGVQAPDVLGPGESMSYRFTQVLAASSPQGGAANAGFMWEARALAEPSTVQA